MSFRDFLDMVVVSIGIGFSTFLIFLVMKINRKFKSFDNKPKDKTEKRKNKTKE